MHDLESSVELPPLRAIVAMTAHDYLYASNRTKLE